MTTVHRVFNFSAGPAVLPLPVLEEIQRDLVALPGVGMSVLEISHRSKAFEDDPRRGRSRHPRAGRHPVELQGAVSAGRREPAVLDGADEPARRRADRRLHRLRIVGGEGDQGSEEGRHGQRRGDDQGRELLAAARSSRAEADAGRGVRPHDVEQHDRGHRVPARCPTSATRRSSATPRRTCSAGRSTSRGTRSSTPARRRTWDRPA